MIYSLLHTQLVFYECLINLQALYNLCTSDSRYNRAKGNKKNQSPSEPLGPESAAKTDVKIALKPQQMAN